MITPYIRLSVQSNWWTDFVDISFNIDWASIFTGEDCLKMLLNECVTLLGKRCKISNVAFLLRTIYYYGFNLSVTQHIDKITQTIMLTGR